ncbi:MAG: S8 family serine peptidase [Elusimicrobia bacterium]|nr:S8 family serine peptidase [Elusimicrobiota bacterium]
MLLARGPGGSPPPSLRNYAFQPEKNAVRVIVAAPRAGPADHLGIGGSAKRLQSERRSIYRERGLDPGLLDRHGSRLVRVIGDLVVVDIPLYEAVPLARDLEKRGIASSPSRVFQAAASQLPLDAALPRDNARSTARAAAAATRPAPYLGGQFLPLSSPEVAEAGHEDSYRRMDLQSLWKLSEGRGTTVGVIDSGIDASHPDFQGRIAEYVDFTGEGLEDVQGHGTHGEGTIGGSGVASGGQYRGVAPQTRFLVAKVFGRNEEASLDTILAAMRWMGERKPDVLNLSFGDKGLDPNQDPLGFLANQLVVKDGILVVSPAGNTGPGFETINTPGNARYVLTVSGVDKDGKFPFFVSQGVVKDKSGGRYNKPDVTAISGGVFVPSEPGLLERMLSAVWGGEPQGCAYAPGVVAARSAADPDTRCALAGNPRYRTLSGTSMAANMGSGAALDVIGYAKGRGIKPRPAEVKAVLQETAVDAGHPREMQGAGLIQGRRLAQAVQERIERGLPIGNVAYMLASRAVTRLDRPALKAQTRYRETPLGLLDVKTGHLVRTEGEMATVMKRLRRREKLTASRPSI